MPEGFEKFSRFSSDTFRYGIVRIGMSGIDRVCSELDSAGTSLFKDRPKITAGKCGGFFVKRYNLPGWITKVRRSFKTSRPMVAVRASEHFRSIGISVPEVIAAFCEYRYFFRSREFLITEMLSENDLLLNKMILNGGTEKVWQLILDKFIPAAVKLHDSGAIHGDMNLRNCYLANGTDAGFIDLDSVKISRKISPAQRNREIAILIGGFFLYNKGKDSVRDRTAEAVEKYNAVGGTDMPVEKIIQMTEKIVMRYNSR